MLEKNMPYMQNVAQGRALALGRQITIEYYECSPTAFLDTDRVEQHMLEAARKSGATVISSNFHPFEPQGVSGVVVIAESHFTVHAWPEHNYAAVDIFSCSDDIDLDVAVESMRQSFESRNTIISSDQKRGIISRPMQESKAADSTAQTDSLPLSWQKEYTVQRPWGISSCLDIYNCDPERIRDAQKIREFVKELCDRIGMKPFGKCEVVHFGEDLTIEGFSMTQLIETSLISGHFANMTKTAYLDLFSCKYYEPREAAEFALSFFGGEHYKLQVAFRQ